MMLSFKKIQRVTFMMVCLATEVLFAQDRSHSKGADQFYKELPNPVATNVKAWAKLPNDINVSFASDNVRYPKEKIPLKTIQKNWTVTGWKGEKVHTQLLVWTKKNIPALSVSINGLTNEKGDRINEKNIKAAFVRYVMSDTFEGGCSHQAPTVYDSTLVADPIDIINKIPVEKNTVRPIWLSIEIPDNIPAGKYSGSITVNATKKYNLSITLNVQNHILPPADQWKYDFDIWQYPAPIARMHNVKLWSDEHFDLMRPYFTALAKAGQKVITANIIEQPWGLDHVHFDDPSLVKWTRKKDGTWSYDFSLFDRYISFVKSCGIHQRINCYSMITWDLSFIYYDEALGKNNTVTLKPGSEEYKAFWMPMLVEFTKHLKAKSWFDQTAIAMDERPIESMQAVISLLKEVDPKWKIALAGDTYHPEIEEDIYDYCLASYLSFGDTVLAKRKAEGKPTTFYTACVEEYPNGYTFSPPAENAWLAWHASAKGYTGYLFWAFNTWVSNPLQDARWRRYPSGTLFQFYPGPRTSIRFEKLIEGIQDFEKIRILRDKFVKEGKKDQLKEMDMVLSAFELEKLKTIPAAKMVEKGKAFLSKY
ncbi:MAG: DUF6067 family protein [Candidatus Pedobacter colombiensis]|uniref:DUF6067 family protein n=1 Tax=Candidatus Pedobacter colombiensis TaxID=3121371 RepID=A0AAJ6B8K6_9SPHI|nr:glycoside hydrolase domain-containing protein [Pedobacter sp.]WEK20989.1 MAG: DUF6067 family protein [Pedobacter sp.]